MFILECPSSFFDCFPAKLCYSPKGVEYFKTIIPKENSSILLKIDIPGSGMIILRRLVIPIVSKTLSIESITGWKPFVP